MSTTIPSTNHTNEHNTIINNNNDEIKIELNNNNIIEPSSIEIVEMTKTNDTDNKLFTDDADNNNSSKQQEQKVQDLNHTEDDINLKDLKLELESLKL